MNLGILPGFRFMWNTFHSISMDGTESIADYTGRIKSAARQLQAAGETVSESQLLSESPSIFPENTKLLPDL